MPDARVHGSCLCGQVRFTAALPSKWVAHCHCTFCRRAHGSAFVTWAGFDSQQVAIDPDGAQPRWFSSSPGAQRGFCPQCGSPMLFTSTRWPGEMHIARALIEGELDREPEAHVFFETHVPWAQVADDLPRQVSAQAAAAADGPA
jgi:hypothetical protein